MFLLSLALSTSHADSLDGSSHWERLSVPLRVHPKLPPGPPPEVWVYGYWAYWAGDLEDLDWSRLSHVAIFNVDMNSDGTVSTKSHWTDNAATAMALAEPYGTKVHLTLTCFDDDVMESVLPSASKRAVLVDELGSLVDAYGAHGVSVDCEGMPKALKADLVTFVQELNERVDEVTVATPAVDWRGAYDYDELALASDGLFIMGYGYHWSSSDPGPVAPLHGGDPWSSYSLAWTVDDYLSNGCPADKIILGLPLYGREWPSTDNSVPGTATASSSAVIMSTARGYESTYGRSYDTVTDTPYLFRSSTSQLWYDDIESIDAKIGWAVDEDLLGVGFWALNYEGGDPEFWQMVSDHTGSEGGEDTDVPRDSAEDSAVEEVQSGLRGSNSDAEDGPRACGCSARPGPGQLGLVALISMSWFLTRRRRDT